MAVGVQTTRMESLAAALSKNMLLLPLRLAFPSWSLVLSR